jgi:4-hydroxy-tetrahydrodipicolinate synthase
MVEAFNGLNHSPQCDGCTEGGIRMFYPKGVVVPLVTPLDRGGRIMEDALALLVEEAINGGAHGVAVLGQTGEAYGLSLAQQRRVIELVLGQAAGRVPLYAATCEPTTRGSIRWAQMVAEVGHVAAILAAVPPLASPSQTALLDHFVGLAAAARCSVVVQSGPRGFAAIVSRRTMDALSRIANLVGVVDCGGELTSTLGYLADRPPGFAVLTGTGLLVHAALNHGADGVLAPTAGLAPKAMVALYNAQQAGDQTASLALQNRIAPLWDILQGGSDPALIKAGLSLIGLDVGHPLAPAQSVAKAERERLVSALVSLDLGLGGTDGGWTG